MLCAAQDLAVVVLLMLIPLLAPNESGAPFGLATISKALGLAAIKVHRCFQPTFPAMLYGSSMS